MRIPGAAALIASMALVACRGPSAASTAPTSAGGRPGAPTAAQAPDLAGGRYGAEPSVDPSALESAVLAAIRAGAPAATRLRTSPSLVLAARELARGAAAGAVEPLAPGRVRAALARSLAFDPAPIAYLVVAGRTEPAESYARSIPARATDSHAGVGAVTAGDRVYVVGLLSSRLATLEPFPRELAPGSRAVLRGTLSGLTRPTVHVTPPSGVSRTVASRTGGTGFSASLDFGAPGPWTVEVVGEGPGGPQVAALLTVWCGTAPPPPVAIEPDPPDPEDAREAEARVVSAINLTRARQRLPPLEASPALAQVAREHSRAMAESGILAHRLPGSGGADERLRHARIPFALVLENVAKGPSAIAAHRLAEESPAHRQNLLSAEATRVGVGLARGTLPGGQPVVYLTEVFVEPIEDGEAGRLTPEARVREVIWQARARAGAAPLVADPVLDELARIAVREMIRDGEPAPRHLADRALEAGRRIAAADAFVATHAGDAARTRNLADARFNRVGIAVAVHDGGQRYGNGLLWIAVIYTE